MPKDLAIESIKDLQVRENFRRLQDLLRANPLVGGVWALRELNIPGAVTNMRVPHGLTFKPTDVWTSRQSGAGALTLNWEKFDRTHLDLTTTGAVQVRLLIGRYDVEAG